MGYKTIEERVRVYENWMKERDEFKAKVEANGYDYDEVMKPSREIIRRACQGKPKVPPRKLLDEMLKKQLPKEKREQITAAAYDVYEELYPDDPYRLSKQKG